MSEALEIARDDRGVVRVTLKRPDVRNAFDEALISGLTETFHTLREDETARAMVLTGAGKAFSAGGDLSWMRRAAELGDAENKEDGKRLAHMLRLLDTLPLPTVCLVNGAAMGGGVGLVSACDIVVASEAAFFALSEVRLGLIPAVISPYVVAAIGARAARRYFLTGERIDAEAAKRIGLAHMVSAHEQLEDTGESVIASLLACGPKAQGEAKALIRAVNNRDIDDDVAADTAARIARVRSADEAREGITAFLEKRKPNWTAG